MRGFRFAGTVFAAATLLAAYPVRAQQPPAGAGDGAQAGDGRRDEARRRFEAGEAAFESNDYLTALAAFQDAFRLAPHDVVRFNIAVCLERLGRLEQARDEYSAAADSTQLDAAQRARARADVERVDARLARLELVGPTGALAFVDGRERCRAPCELALTPGRRQLELRLGERRVDDSLELLPGERRSLDYSARLRSEPRDQQPPRPSPAPGPRLDPEPTPRAPARERSGPTWLTWTGGSLALVGSAGAIGFGLAAQDAERDYRRAPRESLADRGERQELLSNVSLGVAIVGAALVVVDLVRSAASQPDSVAASRSRPRVARGALAF